MKAIFITVFMLLLSVQLQAQTAKDSLVNNMPMNTGIDEFILMVKNKKHRELLEEFAKGRDSLTEMSVQRETKIFYEIWVDYKTADGYNWGEGYTLNKSDGKREMIWHEQPFKSEPIFLDSIPQKKENLKKAKKSNG